MKPIDRYLLVQTLPYAVGVGTGTLVAFPDVPELRQGIVVTGIEAYTSAQLAAVPSGQALISPADAIRAVVVFQEKSTQRVQQVPLVSLVSATQAGIWKEFVPFQPNWQSSYIQFVLAPAAAVVSVAAFGIFYTKE